MTGYIEQRVDELENQVAKLELIIHELRGKKPIEPSTTNTVGDIIEFEGQQYRKVDREACEGDVVIITKEHESSNAFKINKPYKVLRGIEIRSDHPDHGYATYNVYTNLTDIRTPKTVNVYELIESKPLTPNQQRFLTIINAKRYVAERQAVMLFGQADFIVNTEKRTIVALLKPLGLNQVVKRGIAKCDPSDVFNEHIGKAIALGRALGIDVSEFEQAVQPTEIVIGQIVKSGLNGIGGVALKSDKENYSVDYAKRNNLTIINDTNAIYGGVE